MSARALIVWPVGRPITALGIGTTSADRPRPMTGRTPDTPGGRSAHPLARPPAPGGPAAGRCSGIDGHRAAAG
jgi:hypothetical protein